ncbi:MAG TPA: VIT1/CCC1 transporter family protein [Acidimicrobiales bacterium]|nr:VIT1/CCC1 transporter family protein [Acidimicrobiales bacterium]
MESSTGEEGSHGHVHVHGHEHHRDVGGGPARAAVFGVSDGLVSNVGLILGVAGASPGPGVVRVAGLAGLIAGAISMAAGEYNSMRVQAELLERELEIERRELKRNPAGEMNELAHLYQSRGVPADQARELAQVMMRDPELALEVHAREELGIDPNELGSPLGAAASSFSAFTVGAVVPLVPWFISAGNGAIIASLVLAVIAAVVVGTLTARFTGRSLVRTVSRQVAFTLVPAAITFAIGSAIGASV